MTDFLDLQINGCWGIDFNAKELSLRDWNLACAKLKQSGTAEFLPTIITDSMESMIAKIARTAEFCEQPVEGSAKAVGIHIEGPFISRFQGYVGAHPSHFAIEASTEFAQRLVDAGRGWVRMVTLAPERDEKGTTIDFLARQGILVSAGHTNASLEQLHVGLDNGLRCFTHLGNGCPAELPRHDNIIHRVMSIREKLHITLIADGYHLPLWMVQMLIEWFGEDRSIIVSDAISAAGLPAGYHTLGEQRVWVGNDGVPRSEDQSHFVGSGATLDQMVTRLEDLQSRPETFRRKLFRENAANLLSGLTN